MGTGRRQTGWFLALGAALGGLLLGGVPRACALDPDRRISQYAHTAWRVRDGLFAGAPIAIAQTTDGYVWIGTHAGLVRFDGIRFVTWTPPAGKLLPSDSVNSLWGAADGSLWIGTAAGLAQWKNGDLINYPETQGRVNAIYEDREGTIWMTRSRTYAGGICQVKASVPRCYTPQDGVAPYAGPLTGDNLGFLWVGETTALLRWKPGSSPSRYELAQLKSSMGLNGVNALAVAPDGSVWVGFSRPGHGLGLQHWVNGSWKALTTPTFDSSALTVNGLWVDRHNALWIAAEGAGIYRVHDGKVDRFRGADGLSSDAVQSFFEDREGNLWLTAPEGVDCFRDIPVANFTVREGLTADDADSVLAGRDGTIWMGNRGGLDYMRGDTVSSIGPKSGLPGIRLTSLFEDHAGRVWVGVDNGLFLLENGRFRPIRGPSGSTGIVLGMTEDVDHSLWAIVIGTRPGKNVRHVVQIRGGRLVDEISNEKLVAPQSLVADPQGGIWVGTGVGSLARYRTGQLQIFPLKGTNSKVFQVDANSDGSVLAATTDGLVDWQGGIQHTLSKQNGLPCSQIYAFITDKHSNLWLYAECGLILLKPDDVQRWREHPDATVRYALFDASEGALPFLPPFRPVATRSNDGRLWFANETVVQMIDPDRLFQNSIPPPVHIEDVVADRRNYLPRAGLHLPALTRDLEIDYTALSFVAPEKVEFRYKLDGYDADWQDAKTRRQAFYSNLHPGHYRFQVMASNNSGVWNEEGATLDLNIAPAYYQTSWFRFAVALACIAVLWILYRLRLRQVAKQMSARFEERIAERNRLAGEFHDTILQTVQAAKLIAENAQAKESSDPVSLREEIHRISEWLTRATTEGRTALSALRNSTKQNNDLAAALQYAAENAQGSSSIKFVLSTEGATRTLHPIVRDEIYRVGSEAIRNAVRHSAGNELQVGLTYGQDFVLRVSDNGQGMDPEIAHHGRAGHYGLLGMRERASRIRATLRLRSRPKTGTDVELRVPGQIAYRSKNSAHQKLAALLRFMGKRDR